MNEPVPSRDLPAAPVLLWRSGERTAWIRWVEPPAPADGAGGPSQRHLPERSHNPTRK